MNSLVKLADLYLSLKTTSERAHFWGSIINQRYSNTIATYCVDVFDSYLNAEHDMLARIENSCIDSFNNAKKRNVQDIKKYVKEQGNLYFPLMFQPPIITSAHAEKRKFINAVFSRWDVHYWMDTYLKHLKDQFASWEN